MKLFDSWQIRLVLSGFFAAFFVLSAENPSKTGKIHICFETSAVLISLYSVAAPVSGVSFQ
jgi:hypothetical protein